MVLFFRKEHLAFLFLNPCLLLAGCQGSADKQVCQIAHVADLKLDEDDHAFYTGITINGHDARLQLDTGSYENLITDATARRLGMSVHVSGLNSLEGLGGSRDVGTAQSHDVRLGEAHGENLAFSTIPAAAYRGADGLLGMNFLYGFDMDLDFWGGRVGLYKALAGCARPAAALAQPLHSVELIRNDYLTGMANSLSPAIYVSINGVKLRAVIDTGAGHSTIFRDSARRAGLGEAALLATGKTRGLGPRAVKTDIRMSAPVVIGDLTLQNMPILVADQRHIGDTDMLLGYDFVTRVHLWVSHSSNTLIMQFPPRASVPRM